MTDRATKNGTALSLVIVSLMAMGGVFGVLMAVTPGAQGDTCGQSSGLQTGNWVVTTPQTCTGQFYVDGNLYVRSTGSLTILNGGITIVQDLTHVHALYVDASGSLILDNSTLTTATNTLTPYVKLDATVNGTLVLRNNAILRFPGTLALTSGSTLNMTGSTVTGFSDAALNGLGTTGWVDDNDDSAVIAMTGSTAYLYHARIDKIYENTQPGGTAKNLTLSSGSTMYAYDSYVGVDFSSNWQVHNVMNVDTTSRAYLYNVTIDQVQSDGTPQYQQLPAFIPAGNGAVYLMRWMQAKATDPYGTGLQNSTLWSHIGTQTAQYPDNGNAVVPGSRTLWYIGRTAADWNVTNLNGQALIPLWTDTITASSLPNALSFGDYQVTGLFNGTGASAQATFPPYPSITAANNTLPVQVIFNVSGLTPDLSIAALTLTGGHGVSDSQPLNTQILVTATIHNAGQVNVRNIKVAFYSVNVDSNGDGLMDAAPAAYAQYLIGTASIALMSGNTNASVAVTWWPNGTLERSAPISVVVDPPLASPTDGGAIPETNELNNIVVRSVTLFTWPDLSLSESPVEFVTDAVVDNPTQILVTVNNDGTNVASSATLKLYDNGVAVSTGTGPFNVAVGGSTSLTVTWTPSTVGNHTLAFLVNAANSTMRNTDYLLTNNVQVVTKSVASQPDLYLLQSDYPGNVTVNLNQAFAVNVVIYNQGQTPASNVTVAAYLDGNRSSEYGRTSNLSVSTTTPTNTTINIRAIATPGNHTLMLVVDPDNRIHEGGAAQENNNFANITVEVLPPQGAVYVGRPTNGTSFQPSETLGVIATVRDKNGNPIPGLSVNVTVWQNGAPVQGKYVLATSDTNGQITVGLPLNGLSDGTYEIRISSSQPTISPGVASFGIHANVPFLNQPVPILGIQWWLLLVIIAAVAAILIGVTVYFKVYGLGKMVECGECGAFIPEDATVCPKCGVEFEKDMAKCSNCQAWIPVDVKQCPECGVEFATGEVEMADYQEKMRLQYDEVVAKFKDEAQRQLGRALSDREFQEWWRKQPTFVTFEDWLREEEEMRKMGSKPCPVCGTLNSVTATVCHKCGSLMKESAAPPSGGSGGAPPAAPMAAAAPTMGRPPASEPQGTPPGTSPTGNEPVRRVIRRPLGTTPLVQKRVIKRPLGEGQQGDQSGAEQDQEDKTEDEL